MLYDKNVYMECMTKVYDKMYAHERHLIDAVSLFQLLKLLDIIETDESDNLNIQYCFRCEEAHDTRYSNILYSVGGEAYFCDTDCLAEHLVEHLRLMRKKKEE